MDPLSISASIIGITTAALKISRVLKTFVEGANGARTSARSVYMEVTGIYVCLHQLQDFLLGKREASRSRRSLVMIEHLIIVFTDCVSIFSELEQTLESVKTDEHMGIIDKLKWSMKENTISKLLLRLQSSKASLNFMLTILSCTSMEWAEASTRSLSSLVRGLLRSNVDMVRRLEALERMHPALASSLASRGNSPTNETDDSHAVNRRATCLELPLDQELQMSPVYRRVGLKPITLSQSSISSNGLSSLSGLSLLNVSDVSALYLPISSAELWNHHRYVTSGQGAQANVTSLEAWYNPPSKKSAFIRTEYFNGQYTNQYAQSKFRGHLVYRRFTITPNSTPVFTGGVVMPQSPKELGRITEEVDIDAGIAELEDTGTEDKALRCNNCKPLPDVPLNVDSANTMCSAKSSSYHKPERHGTVKCLRVGAVPSSAIWPKSRAVCSPPTNPPPETPPPRTPSADKDGNTMASLADSSTHRNAEYHSTVRCPQIGAVRSFAVSSESRPVYLQQIDPPSRTPPHLNPSTDQDSNAMAPNPRRKVNSSTYSIICEEEETIFPTRKWTKPLSGMGDASKWKMGVLRKFSAIEY